MHCNPHHHGTWSITFSYHVTLCSLVHSYCFKRNLLPPSITLNMETAGSSKTFVLTNKLWVTILRLKFHIHGTSYYSLSTTFTTLLLNLHNLNHLLHECGKPVTIWLVAEHQTYELSDFLCFNCSDVATERYNVTYLENRLDDKMPLGKTKYNTNTPH